MRKSYNEVKQERLNEVLLLKLFQNFDSYTLQYCRANAVGKKKNCSVMRKTKFTPAVIGEGKKQPDVFSPGSLLLQSTQVFVTMPDRKVTSDVLRRGTGKSEGHFQSCMKSIMQQRGRYY